MPIQLDSVEQLHDYLTGIVNRAEHHAPEIQEIILTLAGALILRKDADSPLEARTYGGSLANLLWATINGQRYAFSYDHNQRRIVIKRGTSRGRIVAFFDNNTSTGRVINLFEGL